jgi:hypothetical protein
MDIRRRFLAWLIKDWHYSRSMLLFFVCMCFAFEPTLDGLLMAHIVHHSVMSTIFGFALAIDSALRRYTKRSYMNNW